MSELDAFFDGMTRFLRGDLDAAALRDRLGPSPSAPGRFTFYRGLIRANHRRVLAHLFPAAQHAYAGGGGAPWPALVDAFARAHPCGDWDLNAFGAAFPAFLEGRPDRPDAASLAQVADYEYAFYRVTRAPDAFDPAVDVVNPTVTPRSYTCDVPAFVRSVRRGAPARLAATPITGFLYRRPDDRQVRWLRPTLARLLAFARATGEIDDAACAAAGVESPALDAATDALVRAGVLGRGARR